MIVGQMVRLVVGKSVRLVEGVVEENRELLVGFNEAVNLGNDKVS